MKYIILAVVVFILGCESQKNIKVHSWNNTLGSLRSISSFEKNNSPINAVGVLECQLSEGNFSSSSAIITSKLKNDKNVIMFSGHSLCEGKQQIKKEKCQFIHQYKDKLFRYPLKKIKSLYQCQDETFTNDIAIASLPYFDKSENIFFAQTKEISQRRIVINGEVTYKSADAHHYGDSEQFLVGFDLVHQKIMVSQNCGLFDKSEKESLFKNKKDIYTHDCKQAPGYSGGAIFSKKYDFINNKNSYKLICINSGVVVYKNHNYKNYLKLVAGETGGRCTAINNKLIEHLYNLLD